MAHSKYSYSDDIKESEDDTFEYSVTKRGYIEDACVQGKVPMDSKLNYFECEIASNGHDVRGIWIGIGQWSDTEDSNPQMGEHRVYYRANSGYVYIDGIYRSQDSSESERGKIKIGSATSGDRIGCGIDFNNDHHSDYIHVFFTKNGKQLGDRIRCLVPPFKMCPVVGMSEKGQRIRFLQHGNRPSLLSAVKKCDTDVVGMLLHLECSNAPIHDVMNSCILVAFHEACSLGLADVVEAFLECNGNDLITTRDGNGLNALQIATMNKRNLVVQILLRRDGSKRAHREIDEDGCTPLLVAAKCGDKDTFSCLLEHVSQLVVAGNEEDTENIVSRSKDTNPKLLHEGIATEAAAGRQQGKELFSKKGSSENAGATEMQPLGSSQDIKETDSETAIPIPHEDSLNRQEDSQSVRHVQESEEIRKLRKKHRDIFTEVRTKKEESHKNVLHLAAENGHVNILKFLWSQSYSKELFVALMTRTDKDGNTPFHLCCKNGHTAVAQEFLAILDEDGVFEHANRYVQRRDLKEETYFDLLNIRDDTPTEYSLDFPADYYSPMHLACLHGHEEVFQLLHNSKHFNVHITNGYQQTLMHIAAAGGYMEIIEMLIDAQADLSAKDANNQTPLHYAARNGRVEAVRRLMDIAHDQAIKAAEDRQRARDKKRKRRNVERYRDADIISFDFDDDDENFEEYEAIWYGERRRARDKKRKRRNFRNADDSSDFDDEDKNLEEFGHSYLDEAIWYGQREVVNVIISDRKLDDITYTEHTLSLLVKHMPDVAKSVLDECIKPGNWDTEYYKETCEVEFDYDLLKRRLGKVPQSELFSTFRRFKTKQSPRKIKTTYGWKYFLWNLTKSDEEDIIKHPIVEGFVHSIWKQKYRWIYYSSLLLHVIFVAMLTCLALLLSNPTSSTCLSVLSGQLSIPVPAIEAEVNISQIPDGSRDIVMEHLMSNNITVTENLTNVSSNSLCTSSAAQIRDILTTFTSFEIDCDPECGIKNSILDFIRALAVILIIISSVKIVSELGQLLHGCCEPLRNSGHRKYWWFYFYYLADLANWLELPLYVFAIIFSSSQLNTECTCIQTWQWSIGIAALFLAWASLILFLRKLDLFDTGIYVLMFEILVRRFLKTIILTSLLVVMFALTFFLAFNQIDPSFVSSPFSSTFTSLWKVMTMVTGEMDYESIFRQSSSGTTDPDSPLPFPEMSYLLWIVFLVMIPILLGNLLTGLAVDDVKEILKTAEVRKLKSKIDLIVNMHQLSLIWFTILLYVLLPVLTVVGSLISCFIICPFLICYYVYGIFHERNESIMDKIIEGYISLMEYLFQGSEPKISTTTVRPFKLRSPWSASKSYKSPKSLANIIEKPSPEEKIPDLLKVMESALEEKMESCLKKEVETCLREKLQHCILEEMKTHFKLMEDNVVKRMEQMMKVSMDEKLEVSDSASPIDEQKKQVS